MKKEIYLLILVIIILLLGISILIFKKSKDKKKTHQTKTPTSYQEKTFNLNLIKTVNSTETGNYLISPYSIEMALSMLREGSAELTKEELEKVIPKRKIEDISIKDRIGISNAIFIKDIYNNYIEKEYKNKLKEEYQAEVLTDSFKTPAVINNWVNQKTYQMIPSILDDISKDFVLGLANAVAIDVEWATPFDCINTRKELFNKNEKEQLEVEMMHETFENNATYFKTNNSEGVILPYSNYSKDGKKFEGNEQLEFIGILPKEDISTYIEKLSEEELALIDKDQEKASKDFHISLSLPRFSYDYELENFIDILKSLGIKEAFDSNRANFTNIMSRTNMEKTDIRNIYVDTAIHKTHIDLNEKGTKAAAITYIGLMKATAMKEEPKIISISFNKPFVYIIRDKNTKEMLFFGVVNEPNLWTKTTCEEE